MRTCGSLVEHRSGVGVGLCRGEGKMPRSLLEVLRDAGELGVKGSTLRGSELAVRRRGEQRVREADDAVFADGDDAAVDGSVQQACRVSVYRREQRRRRSLGGRGDGEEATNLLRLLGGARLDELQQRRWNRQRRELRPAPVRKRAREFEREHRVASRRLVNAGQRGSRNPDVKPSSNQMRERAEAQRLEAKLAEPRLVDSTREVERIAPVAPLRNQDSDRRVAEPSCGEGERAS
jgi:hypothetical protein